jgi:serine/threonine protein kinase
MWSLGCIIAELISGKVLFNCKNESDLLQEIIRVIGNLPAKLKQNDEHKSIKQSTFANQVDPNLLFNKCNKDNDITDFVRKCLILDPDKRMKPKEALEHHFLKLKGEKIKNILNKVEILPISYRIANHQQTNRFQNISDANRRMENLTIK